MTTQTETSALVITRYDTFEREDTLVLRLFAKRKLAGEVDADDAREDYEESLPTFLALKPRVLTQVLDFLSADPEDEEDEEADGGSIVPAKYRVLYGAPQRCGDDVSEVLSGYVTLPRNAKDIDGGLDRALLRAVAVANGIGDRLDNYEAKGLNGGLLRMNISNILRGMVRRGERVVIGDRVWAENLENPKHPANKGKKAPAAK